MASYEYRDPRQDFQSMRQEALRRMQEMQSRSQNPQEETSRAKEPPPKKESLFGGLKSDKNILGTIFGDILGVKTESGENGGILAQLNIDEEKILIALMIYILYKNKADLKLLIGLGYLLL